MWVYLQIPWLSLKYEGREKKEGEQSAWKAYRASLIEHYGRILTVLCWIGIYLWVCKKALFSHKMKRKWIVEIEVGY